MMPNPKPWTKRGALFLLGACLLSAAGARADDSSDAIPWGSSQKPPVLAENCPATLDPFFWSYLAHAGKKEEDSPYGGISQGDWSDMGHDDRLSALFTNCYMEYQDKQVYDSILPRLNSADADAKGAAAPLDNSQRQRLIKELQSALDDSRQGEQALVALAGDRTDWAEINDLKRTYDDVQQQLNKLESEPQKAALNGAGQSVPGGDLGKTSRSMPGAGSSGGGEAQETQTGAAFTGATPGRSLAGGSNGSSGDLPRTAGGAAGNLSASAGSPYSKDANTAVAMPDQTDPNYYHDKYGVLGAKIGAPVGAVAAGAGCATSGVGTAASVGCGALGAAGGAFLGGNIGAAIGDYYDNQAAKRRQNAQAQQQLQQSYVQSLTNP